MAASNSQQPQNIKLPMSSKASKQRTSRKGKEKEKNVTPSAIIAESTEGVVESTWPWMSLTDSSASKHPPLFTKDGSYFFSIVGPSVKIHSVATGQVVSTLHAPSQGPSVASTTPLHNITSATLNPHNAFQLITGSLSGYIMIWDFLDGVLLQTIDIGQSIHHICAHVGFKDVVFVAASRRSNNLLPNDDNAVVLRVSLKASNATLEDRVQKSSEVTSVGKTKLIAGLAFSPSGTWLVAIGGHKAYVAMTSSLKSGFTKYVSPERLTCLAFHPSEEYFATGDVKGAIRLWYCLTEDIPRNAFGVEKKAPTTTLHWHAHAVSSIAFTPNGAYLLSGGEESVLVIWQVHTGRKEFVPRVGAPIQTVATYNKGDEEEYLLGLADATYAFVSARSLKLSRSYSRIKLDPSSHLAPAFAPLAVHTSTSTLVLPSSHPSSLQVYSPMSSKIISELEVSPSNRVSRRDEQPLEPTRVEHTAISSSGEWMATIDEREADDTFRGEIYLKIWWWEGKTNRWILNTRIDRPHGLKKVLAMAFSPEIAGHSNLNLVTTGRDGNVKMWSVRRAKKKNEHSEAFWICRSTFGFRSKVPTHVSWSPDGSLLAIAIGPYLTLWDPATNILRQSLTFPGCKTINLVHFVGRAGRYLVIVGAKNLILWDLVMHCVRWTHRSPSVLETLVPHPLENTFALFHSPVSSIDDRYTQVSVFHIDSPTPSQIHTVPFRLLNIIWYPLSQSPPLGSCFNLVGITKTWSVVLVGDEAGISRQPGLSPTTIVGGQSIQKRTLFQDIFGKSAFIDTSNEARAPNTLAYHRTSTGKEIAEAFDNPTYLIPPLESLFDSLIRPFLKARPKSDAEVARNGESAHGDHEDVDMEDETAGPPVVIGAKSAQDVSRDEMAIFVDLFKKNTGSPIPIMSPLHRKSASQGNGISKSRSNGTVVPPAPATPILSNGITRQPQKLSAKAPEILSIPSRGKRKQSTG